MSKRTVEMRSAALNAENALLDGGSIVLTDADLGAGNVLATITLEDPAFATSTDGTAACEGFPASVTPTGAGPIAGYKVLTSGGATRLTGHSSELDMDDKVLVEGIDFTFNGWTRTAPEGT